VPVAFTVSEFVALGRTPHAAFGWSPLSEHDRSVIADVLEMMDITALADRSLDELSAGEKQRAVVALALAQEPRILLLDEPTAHLDIQHAWSLMELIHGLNESRTMTVVLSSHDLNLAAEFCSHLLLIEKGRIAAQGRPCEVMDPIALSRIYEHPLDVQRGDGRLWVAPRRKRQSSVQESRA
jgi:iron complex transport system ATP-binding protein